MCIRDRVVIMAAVLASRQVLVREYFYTMNGVHTGTLFLMDSPFHAQQVSWYSSRTGLRTSWHGSWESPSGNPDQDLTIYFDFQGNLQQARRKWTMVRRTPPAVHLTGHDFQLRGITMQLMMVWTFDQTDAAYVVHTP